MSQSFEIESLELARKYFIEKNFKQAEVLLHQILSANAQDSGANELIAYILDARNQTDLAYTHLATACLSPNCSFQALYSLGSYCLEKKQYQEAIEYFTTSLKKQGNYFEGIHDLGMAYIGLKQFKEASRCLLGAVDLQPKSFEALNNLGATLRNLGEFSESLKYLDQAIAVDSMHAAGWLNKGVTFDGMGQFAEALICYDEVLRLNPTHLEAICNKANTLQGMRSIAEANNLYRAALEINPHDADSGYNQSLLHLLEGHLIPGWKKYEARWNAVDAPRYLFDQIPRLYSQAGLENKKVLVWAEQGLGDTIQFCRYAPMLHELGAKITLSVQPPLVELLNPMEGVYEVLGLDAKNTNKFEEFDFQIPLMSLPLLFNTDLTSIPNQIPYVFANQNKVKVWQERLGKKSRLRVGIVWSGGFREDTPSHWAVNRRRNIPFEKIASLQDLSGVDFFSLQKGEPAESELRFHGSQLWKAKNLTNYVGELGNFSDTAALIQNLDLVISVDTSTAHLAAAMGKPVWILNRFDSCWRWLLNRIDSPWYPTVRLYNSSQEGNWDEVLANVKRDIFAVANNDPVHYDL